MSIQALYLDLLCLSFTLFFTCSDWSTLSAGAFSCSLIWHYCSPVAAVGNCGRWSDRYLNWEESSLHPCELVYSCTEQSLWIIPISVGSASRRHSQSRSAFSVNSNGRFDTFSLTLIWLSFLSFFAILSSPLTHSHPGFPLALRKSGCTQTKGAPADANAAQQNAGFTHTHIHTQLAQDAILLDWTGIVWSNASGGGEEGERANVRNHFRGLSVWS